MDELNKIAPKLSELKKQNSFQVPDNYFEDFPSRIQGKISTPEPGTLFLKLYSLLKPQLVLATVMIGFGVIAFLVMQLLTTDQTSTKTIASNNIVSEYEAYAYIDEALIVDYLASESEYFTEETFNEDEAYNYLLDNDIIIDEIYDEQ